MNKIEGKKIFPFTLVLLLATSLGFLLYNVFFKSFDADEFEHIQATWQVFNGMIPYKDFFEHHPPLHYYFFSPFLLFFPSIEESFEVASHSLNFFRVLSLICALMISVPIWKHFKTSPVVALMIICLLFSSPVFLEKSIEFRPDVPGLFLLVWGLYFFTGKKHFWAGFFFGLAQLFTQKYLLLFPGILILQLYELRHRNTSITSLLRFYLALSLPLILTSIYFLWINALSDFIHYTYLINFSWKGKIPLLYTFERYLSSSSVTVILGLSAMFLCLKQPHLPSKREKQYLFLFIWLMLSLLIFPVPQLQYFLMIAPIALLGSIPLLYRFINQYFPHNRELVACLSIIFLFSLSLYTKTPIDTNYRNNQMLAIKSVFENSTPQDTYLGGHPNYTIFRNSFFYYGFIHFEIFLMIPREEVRKLERRIFGGNELPTIVALDSNLKRLSPKLFTYFQGNYKELENTSFKYAHGDELVLLKK